MMPNPSPEHIRSALDEILPTVQKPSRYLGLERNLTRKAWDDAAVTVALAFPDAYEIGMSHQGSRILYHLINRRPDALAERCFAPMPDMAAALRAAGLPLYTLESYRPVRDFDVVGISLQSELNYINVPYLLDLAGIPRRAERRGADDPLVLGGGPCTANPEPVADFFDAILIGDARGRPGPDPRHGARRPARPGRIAPSCCAGLARIEGVYVPRFYHWRPGSNGRTGPMGRARRRRTAACATECGSSTSIPRISPSCRSFPSPTSSRTASAWRSCAAAPRAAASARPATGTGRCGSTTRRWWSSACERQVDETGFEEVGLLSLSSADYSQVEPLVHDLAERLGDRRVSVSLPSLRADAFSVGLAEAVSRVRKSGFTFAPETGSDRLRRVINKTFTNADMVRRRRGRVRQGVAPDQGLRHDRPAHRDRRRPRGAGQTRRGSGRGRPPGERPPGRGQGLGGLLHSQGVDARSSGSPSSRSTSCSGGSACSRTAFDGSAARD